MARFPAETLAKDFLRRTRKRGIEVVCYAEDVYEYARGLWTRRSEQWLCNKVQRLAKRYELAYTWRDIEGVAKLVQTSAYLDESVQPPFWRSSGKNADVIVTANCILELDVRGWVKCRSHDSDLFALAGVPFLYNPTAACPDWEAFVLWMVGGDEEQARLLQQFCAWSLIIPRLPLEYMLWMVGSGNNGKSTFLKIVNYVLGEDSTTALKIDAFSGASDFRLWPVLHKLAVFCAEADPDKLRSVANLNSFVSHDPISVNRKMQKQVTVRPYTACFFASNQLPIVDDASDAFWRRLLLIKCEQKPSEPDPTLEDRLKTEASGILNWLLEPIPLLIHQKRFDVPLVVRQNVAGCHAEVNAARQFISEKLERGDEKDFIPGDQLLGLFAAWCSVNGYRQEKLPVLKAEMLRCLGSEYARVRRGLKRGRYWLRVRWQEDEKPPKQLNVTDLNEELGDLQLQVSKKKAELNRLRQRITDIENGTITAASVTATGRVQAKRSKSRVVAGCCEDGGEEIERLIRETEVDLA